MSATIHTFGPFELGTACRRLQRAGDALPFPDRHFDILVDLVAHAGTVLSKDALIAAAWHDVAVTDNGLESTARVRIAGTSMLTMRDEYESINRIDVTAPASADAPADLAGTASAHP